MNFKLIPFKKIESEITRQTDPEPAFKNILKAAKTKSKTTLSPAGASTTAIYSC
jgi:hypothetical protein